MSFIVYKARLDQNGEYHRYPIDDKQCSIGTSASDAVYTAGLAEQALTLTETDIGLDFSVGRQCTATLDGNDVSQGSLKAGSTLHIAGYDFSLVIPEHGYDFAVQIDLQDAQQLAEQSLFPVRLNQTKLPVRLSTIVLAILVIVMFGFIPLVGTLSKPALETLQSIPGLPSPSVWTAGPMSGAHSTPEIGSNCEVCHVQSFTAVPNQQCETCHANLAGHHEPNINQQCVDCHQEHNDDAHIVPMDDGLCIDCHQTPTGNKQIPAVTRFNVEQHPPFRLTAMVRKAGGHDLEKVKAQSYKEDSGIKFPHWVHLDDSTVQEPANGDALQCDSCHTLLDGGEIFAPIQMEAHCQRCHELPFDSLNGAMKLPHVDVTTTYNLVENYYFKAFLDTQLSAKRGKAKALKSIGRRTASAGCDTDMKLCAAQEAAAEIEFQFTKGGCVSCHVIDENAEASSLAQKYAIRPVHINADWFPSMHYKHESHLVVSGIDDINQACETCHAARDSRKASDSLIPNIDTCVNCHASDKNVVTSCGSCHDFHAARR